VILPAAEDLVHHREGEGLPTSVHHEPTELLPLRLLGGGLLLQRLLEQGLRTLDGLVCEARVGIGE
jgi:hypothetical protein